MYYFELPASTSMDFSVYERPKCVEIIQRWISDATSNTEL